MATITPPATTFTVVNAITVVKDITACGLIAQYETTFTTYIFMDYFQTC